MPVLIAGFIATVGSFLLTRLMLRAPIKDVPVERSSHTTITPRAGGVAIVLSWLLYLTLIHFMALPVFSSYMLLLILSAGTMAVVGFCDDVFQLSYLFRLAVQIIIAFIMIQAGLVINEIPLPGVNDIPLGPLAPIITLLWVVGFINAFNFMDGLNGLSSGGALVVSIILLLFMNVLTPLSFVLYGLIFALAGFMRYNFVDGRIFMGEVGSQFLGTLFAVMTLMVEPVTSGELRFYVIPLLFAPFIFDTSLTFIRRVLQKKNVLEAHREFLFHRLNHLGCSHMQVSLIYMLLICFQGVFVYYFLKEPSFTKLGLNFGIYGVLSSWVYMKTSEKKVVSSHA